MHVLVAEVEQTLAAAISHGLRRHRVTVDVAAERVIALGLSAATTYDVIVLGPDLQRHGDELCRQLRRQGCKAAILALIAAGSGEGIAQRPQRLGADDVLQEPFSIDELLSRIRALGDPGSDP